MLLEVKGLRAGYGQTHVLHGLDFVVEDGGVTALLGALLALKEHEQTLLERGTGRVEAYAATGGPTYGLDLATVLTCARERVTS